MPAPDADLERARLLLCQLQDHLRDAVLAARLGASSETLSAVAAITAADTIYAIDKVSEDAVLEWLTAHWPREWPVQLVMEGIPDETPHCFPAGTPAEATAFVLILDPVDGTRGLMHDKRSAWVLAGLAPRRGGVAPPRLADIAVAAMTELPTTKQWRADQVSAVRGTGRVVAESVDVRSPSQPRAPLAVHPSRATDFRHGFAALSRFFPEGKALTARIEEDLWAALYGAEFGAGLVVFDDQYICTGGQIYELLVGHDRMCGDIRPLVHAALGIPPVIHCHPYDICTALLLEEAGGVVETPSGGPLDLPLDTVTSVSWLGFANETLAALVRPALREAMRTHLRWEGSSLQALKVQAN